MELVKDESILKLIKHLQLNYGEQAFKIKDFWDGDLCAIGLTDLLDEHLLYISTYEQAYGCFDVILETKTNDNSLHYVINEIYKNVSLQELEKLLLKHLQVKAD